MRSTWYRPWAAGAVGFAVLLTVGGCTADAAPAPEETAPTAPATSATDPTTDPSAVTVDPGPGGPTEEPGETISLGPDSIVLLGRRTSGEKEEFEVRAPSDTRFRVGPSAQTSAVCAVSATTVEAGDVRYELRCPRPAAGDLLVSITTFGDYDYTFTKQLS